MTRERKSATILKPEIDEEAALQFAAAGTAPAPSKKTSRPAATKEQIAGKTPDTEKPKGTRQISLTVKKSLYDRIAKDAARKNRTVEEHLKKHLAKRYAK